MFEKLLYLPLDIENPPLDCLDKLNDIDYRNIIRDDFRNCWHVPLMHSADKTDYQWTPYANDFPSLKEWAEDVVFPYTGKSRIMIITTKPGQANPPHIDCSPEMFSTLQHKFRYVLQGNVDDLVFMSDQGDISLKEEIDKPFIMSGRWPHYMLNTHTNTKFTFAFGAPWDSNLNNPKYYSLLLGSKIMYNDYYIDYEDINLPLDYERYYEQKYK